MGKSRRRILDAERKVCSAAEEIAESMNYEDYNAFGIFITLDRRDRARGELVSACMGSYSDGIFGGRTRVGKKELRKACRSTINDSRLYNQPAPNIIEVSVLRLPLLRINPRDGILENGEAFDNGEWGVLLVRPSREIRRNDILSTYLPGVFLEESWGEIRRKLRGKGKWKGSARFYAYRTYKKESSFGTGEDLWEGYASKEPLLYILPHAGREYAGEYRDRVLLSDRRRLSVRNLLYLSTDHGSNNRALESSPPCNFLTRDVIRKKDLDHSFTWVCPEIVEAFPNLEELVVMKVHDFLSVQSAIAKGSEYDCIIGTTDMSHRDFDSPEEEELALYGSIVELNPAGIYDLIEEGTSTACGLYSVLAIVLIARRLNYHVVSESHGASGASGPVVTYLAVELS